MSVIKRKKVHEHATWLISSIFLVLMPGLGRGLGQIAYYQLDSSYALGLKASMIIIMLAIVVVGLIMKKLFHPAFTIALLINILFLFTWEIGSFSAYQEFIVELMKPLP